MQADHSLTNLYLNLSETDLNLRKKRPSAAGRVTHESRLQNLVQTIQKYKIESEHKGTPTGLINISSSQATLDQPGCQSAQELVQFNIFKSIDQSTPGQDPSKVPLNSERVDQPAHREELAPEEALVSRNSVAHKLNASGHCQTNQVISTSEYFSFSKTMNAPAIS